MQKFSITPNSGPLEAAKRLSVNLNGLNPKANVRVRFENATYAQPLSVENGPGGFVMSPEGSREASGFVELSLPDASADTAISVFATIEEQQENGTWAPESIVAATYLVSNESPEFEGSVVVEPSFIAPNESAKINVQWKPNTTVVAAINDRRYSVRTDENGRGSYKLRSADINVRKRSNAIQRFAVDVFTDDDSYVSKKFSGSYVNVMPDAMAKRVSENIDDSDLANNATDVNAVTTVMPDVPNVDVSNCVDGTATLAGNVTFPDGYNQCRLTHYDKAKLPNGESLVGVLIHDDQSEGEILNTIWVYGSTDGAGASEKIYLTIGQVVLLLGAGGDLNIYVSPRYVNRVNVGDTVGFIYNDERYELTVQEIIPPDEYILFYRLRTSSAGIDLPQEEYCVEGYVVQDCTAATGINGTDSYYQLPPILGSDNEQLPINSFTVASSPEYLQNDESAYGYVIAEAMEDGISNLYFYSFTMAVGGCASPNNTIQTFGWEKITESGSNTNPRSHCDKYGNLHVVWEGHRSEITQVYYGIAGPSANTMFNAAIMSQLDKETQYKIEQPGFDTISDTLLHEIQKPADLFISKICNDAGDVDPYLANTQWSIWATGSGEVNVFDNSLIEIQANPYEEQAMAFTTIDQDEFGNPFENSFKQRQYGLYFQLEKRAEETVYADIELNDEWESWKSQFTPVRLDDRDRLPLYEKNGNRLLIERNERVYDRFTPIAGAYKNTSLADKFENCDANTNEEFVVEISGDQSTLRHWMLGVMPEKEKFTAKNVETLEEYRVRLDLTVAEAQDSYVGSVERVIKTGRYKLFVVMNTLNDYFASPRNKDWALARRIGEPFTLNDEQRFNIVVHYSKMYNEDSQVWNGPIFTDQDPLPRYLFSLMVVQNEQVVFGDSGMVDLSDAYTDIDIGLGIPGYGGFISHVFEPYETLTYDIEPLDLVYNEIHLGSPDYVFNEKYVTYDEGIRVRNAMSVSDTVNSAIGYDYDESGSWLTLGLDVGVMPSLPITLQGYNKNPRLAEGPIAPDIHVVWQSNRDRYWNIYYSNAMDRALPWRHDYQITDTKSNSISPDLSVSREGTRLVVWQDDRDGLFQIYSARSSGSTGGSGGGQNQGHAIISCVCVIADCSELPCEVEWEACVQPCPGITIPPLTSEPTTPPPPTTPIPTTPLPTTPPPTCPADGADCPDCEAGNNTATMEVVFASVNICTCLQKNDGVGSEVPYSYEMLGTLDGTYNLTQTGDPCLWSLTLLSDFDVVEYTNPSAAAPGDGVCTTSASLVSYDLNIYLEKFSATKWILVANLESFGSDVFSLFAGIVATAADECVGVHVVPSDYTLATHCGDAAETLTDADTDNYTFGTYVAGYGGTGTVQCV